MFKKLQMWVEGKKREQKNKQELLKAKRYYSFLKAGATFIKFVSDDINNHENKMNRHQRRRFDAEVHGKGTLSPELIDYYKIKIDYILSEINKRMNPPKTVNTPTPKPLENINASK